MKKLVISLLILVSILAPSACGSASDTDDSPNDAPGDFKIIVTMKDSSENLQTATFNIKTN